MKSITTQHEILLMTDTGFTSQQYYERDNSENSKNMSPTERLQEACWNGLVQQMIPEIFFTEDHAVKLYLWQLREAHHFLSLELGEFPHSVDSFYSIDPYLFMMEQGGN